MYRIEASYLEHDGGTKFYETVLINEDGTRQSILIKRYGKINQAKGGGQTIVERGSESVTRASRVKILSEKLTYRSGKGQYVDKSFPYCLHQLNGKTVTGAELRQMATRHYASADSTAIRDYFSLGEDDNEVITEEPAALPEMDIVRDANWGTW